jgi:hypothetical protein
MSQPAPKPASTHVSSTAGGVDPAQPTSAAAVGNVPFAGVVLASILALVPWSRAVGVALLLLLAVPVLVTWCRARRLGDGSRGLTSSAAVIGASAFIIAAASMPTTTPAEGPVPTPAAAAASAPVASPVSPDPAPALVAAAPAAEAGVPAVVAPQPVIAPQPAVAAPKVPHRTAAPAPTASSGGSAYYQNCAAARAAGAAPLSTGDPGYRAGLDRDGDGIACE